MSDKTAALEERMAALEGAVAALYHLVEASVKTAPDPNDPFAGLPYIAKKPPRELWPVLEADFLRRMGLEGIQPVGAERLRQMMIEDGVDPNTTQFSQGIIDMREE
jgi:hypothetical protein